MDMFNSDGSKRPAKVCIFPGGWFRRIAMCAPLGKPAIGVRLINRALEGGGSATARVSALATVTFLKKMTTPYAFLGEIDDCNAAQVAIEATLSRS
jgi:hypothetical protein